MNKNLKIGDIVKIRRLRHYYNEYTFKSENFIDLIGVINADYIEINGWDYEVKFSCEILYIDPLGCSFERNLYLFMGSDLKKATDREKFLYYTHGSKALKRGNNG